VKINVVGVSGSGKTTVGRRLSEALNVSYIEMDRLFWKPNWTEPANDEFFSRLTEALSKDAWVLDGNYHRTASIKWQSVDVVIWIDFSITRTLWQASQRAIRRAIRHEELWPDTNNRESFRRLFSKDSILLWTIRSYRTMKQRYESIMTSDEYSHIRFIRVRSPKAVDELVKSLAYRQCIYDTNPASNI